jgi:peptide/nickel transport system permease protein
VSVGVVAEAGTAVVVTPAHDSWARRLGRLRRDPGASLGAIVLLVLIAAALGAQILAPADPNAQETGKRLLPPGSSGHLLGTDALGRDILSRLIYGSRVSLIVGFLAVAISAAIGITVGVVSGFYRRTLDGVLSWLGNVQLSFPFILLAIAVVAVLGPGLRNVILVLGVTGWVVYARIARGDVLAVRDLDYVTAARSLGASDLRLMVRHVLPNILPPLIVVGTFEVARMIISEAALSFLGLGVEPRIPSWGSMLADGRQYLDVAWWLATLPGLAIMVTVLGINLLGDWLRDEFDPRRKSVEG